MTFENRSEASAKKEDHKKEDHKKEDHTKKEEKETVKNV